MQRIRLNDTRRSQATATAWLILLLGLLAVLSALPALAAGAAPAREFSFLVFGDTRGEAFIAAGAAQSDKIQEVLRQRYTSPPQLFFDPQTGQLERLVEPTKVGQGPTTYFYRDGRPYLGVRDGQVLLRREGRDWVQRRVAAALQAGAQGEDQGAAFALHTGDFVLWGHQGKDLDHSPDWQDYFDSFQAKVPPPDAVLGLPGRIFPALGNHEVWGDQEITGVLTTMPYLARMGLSKDRRIYSFDHGGCRFIFLDSGAYKTTGEGWFSEQPDFKGQMRALVEWLDEAKALGVKHAFVVFHKPAFCISGHGPLPAGDNPHPFIKPYARDLNITVFNGHVHTTELYEVDGVRYLVLGGGGAPQVLKAQEPPAGYPQERYWQGKPRVEEYNYLLVRVTENGPRMYLHRYRPGEPARPFEKLELFR